MTAAPAIVTLERNRTPRERAMAQVSRGRPTGRLSGGWIADLIALKRSIALCDFCLPKIDQVTLRRAGYFWRHPHTSPRVAGHNLSFVSGPCDGCRGWVGRAKLFMHRDQVTE